MWQVVRASDDMDEFLVRRLMAMCKAIPVTATLQVVLIEEGRSTARAFPTANK